MTRTHLPELPTFMLLLLTGSILLSACGGSGYRDETGPPEANAERTEQVNAPVGPAHLNIEVNDGLVSVDARNVALRNVLDTFAAQSGIEIVARDSLPALISKRFIRLPLDEALVALLSDSGYTVQYGADDVLPVRIDVYASEADRSERADWQISITNADPDVRVDALYRITDGLGSPSDDGEIVALLAESLMDQDRQVKETVIDVLNEIGGQAAVVALEQALTDIDPKIRQDALHALSDIGGVKVQALLQIALIDVDPRVRQDAQLLLDEFNQQN